MSNIIVHGLQRLKMNQNLGPDGTTYIKPKNKVAKHTKN